MADLFDGRDMAGIKASVLAEEQDKGLTDRPVTKMQKVTAIVVIIFLIAILVGIYAVAFSLH
ncbi:MAG: DUF4044 domain-containing protein [Lachnospiraceae bacterium]|nr:DUF4044 domain-containing protein [Lachnospiraceae bacterium]